MAELAKQFEYAILTISEILSNSDYWLNIDEEFTIDIFKRRYQSNFPNIKEALDLWIENAISDKVTLTDSILKEKTKKFAILFDNYEFGATNRWLEEFKKKNSLKSYKKKGEAGSINLIKLPEQHIYLKSILEEIEEVKRKIADLIQRLPIDEPMNIEEYMDIDKNSEIYSFIDENGLFQEIIDTVNHIEILEKDKPSEEQIVTSSEALLGCDNMLAYIAQKNLNVDYSIINTLNKLRKEIS
ncbi:1351_t:CDS:2 [Acaulospora morrowiae]|uniref:1351_t:CDS:1 n=1 Tax=Acaulospora morrowiae TaxID=94023 RepID=A0A9N9H0N9_9GLOM|nr:1351_t:CDS:2 [Acaulospora morrowiae]